MVAENASNFAKAQISARHELNEHISSYILKSENWKSKKFTNSSKIYSIWLCWWVWVSWSSYVRIALHTYLECRRLLCKWHYWHQHSLLLWIFLLAHWAFPASSAWRQSLATTSPTNMDHTMLITQHALCHSKMYMYHWVFTIYTPRIIYIQTPVKRSTFIQKLPLRNFASIMLLKM